MTRPIALPVQPDAIPEALEFEDRWCLWRYRDEGTRWSKVPCMTSGAYARSNDRSTWTSFVHVVAAYRAGGFDGLGFMLGDGWAGIDLDGCEATDAVVARLPCYVERSPSDTGYKAIGRSHRIGGEIKFAKQERTSWSGARFFATTGHGVGDPCVDITEILDEWFRAYSNESSRPRTRMAPRGRHTRDRTDRTIHRRGGD
jgi:putative DNA primase/helicase